MTNSAADQSNSSLSVKQQTAVSLLASGMSYKSVAERVEVAYGTVRNWCSQNSEFKAELRAQQRQLYLDSNARLQALAHEATQALHDVLTDESASARDRISASRTVLSHVYEKQQTHTIRSSDDAAALIAKILNESEIPQ